MFVLGLQGSPRKKGSTAYLLDLFMEEAESHGAETKIINVGDAGIIPCKGCGFCEKKGLCITDDDTMSLKIFSLLRRAEVIVAASPVYFYNVSAQLKTLIDRTQTLWSRKYKFRLTDPAARYRKGVMIAQGATRGDNLFEGISLTMKYFFDAAGADFNTFLTYRNIETKKDLQKNEKIREEIKNSAKKVIAPLSKRTKILFACRENACRSQMAAAFAMFLAGDKIDAVSGGSKPASGINPLMVKVMEEKGIDMAFCMPKSMEEALFQYPPPATIITMGCGEACPLVPGTRVVEWDLPDPAGKPLEFMRMVRDEIEQRVSRLTTDYS